MTQAETQSNAAIAPAPEAPLVEARNVRKTYRLGRVSVPVLRGASLSVDRGEMVAILGASGSGKSTLLHLLGGLDRPDREQRIDGVATTGGDIFFENRSLRSMSIRELDRYRSRRVGFVFQFYHLLPELSVLENTLIGAMIRCGRFGYASNREKLRARAEELLEAFEIGHRLRHRPAELSGGERQRVAIARAMINEPDLILADEPTGNLDQATGGRILDCIEKIHRGGDQTMIMVTHDPAIAERADRQVHLIDGRVDESA